jgi:large subunit ribosomal protein L10
LRKEDKKKVVEELKERLRRSEGIVLTNYQGLTVEEITQLRWSLKEVGTEFLVVKNTLALKAIEGLNLKKLRADFKGPTAIAFGYQDLVSAVKVIKEFSREHENLKIKSGLLKDKYLGLEEISEIANLPSREELLAKVIYLIKSPLVNLISLLQNPLRKFIWVLEGIKKNKQ